MARIGKPLFTFLFLATSSAILFIMNSLFDDYFFTGQFQSPSVKIPKGLTTGTNQNNVTQNTTIKISVSLHANDTQQKRRPHLQEECEGLNAKKHLENTYGLSADTLKKTKNIIVIDKLKTLYCYIPKAGCTTMKRILLELSGHINSTYIPHEKRDIHVLAAKHFRSLSGFSLEDANEKIKTYSKLVFVREPFSRMLSAYRDKLESKGLSREDVCLVWSRGMSDHWLLGMKTSTLRSERIRKKCIEKLRVTKYQVNNQEVRVFVAEDLSKRVQQLRKKKQGKFQQLKEEGKKPFFSYPDKLCYRNSLGKVILIK
ncbi:uncharacterized protein LOC121413113 [Lytechinus variegatus]|uniref:uncharacterized protein LOC121413113 n=1 Tax=Lytechinus variegatus TaxID=7654 RepID=UPI001BB24C27|nr:uncharacterized protein LOC121413113 [Lytechinus variegatus]